MPTEPQVNWRPSGRWHRWVAAGLSAAVTIAMLGLLRARPATSPVAQTRLVALRLILPMPTPVSPAMPTPGVAPGQPVRPTRHRAAKPHAPMPPAQAIEPIPWAPARAAPEAIRAPTQPDAQAAAGAPSAEPVVPAASAPLRLDAATLRAAIAQSKGLVQGPRPVDSPEARLSAGIAAAGKKDCLAANGGGSVLLLPLIAYAAATGRCQ
jgi:hypothetical protein